MSDVTVHRIGSVFHPTDFSKASAVAFEHALAIALINHSYMDILHVDSADADGPDWEEFPHVRKTLERWGLLDKGSQEEALVKKLHIAVRKVGLQSNKLVDAIAKYLEDDPSELVVLATQARTGMPRWMKPSISEPLARRSAIATLFVPAGVRGFVSSDRGDIKLQRVLIPVNHKPDPQVAVDEACMFLRSIDATSVTVDTLHVGDPDGMPELSPPNDLGSSFTQVCVFGTPADGIINAANERDIDLIVMATEGHKGFLDALRGSTTEQVLRRAPCPVLTIPAAATLSGKSQL